MNSPLLLTLALVIFYAGVTLLFIEKKSDRPIPVAVKAGR
jgi:hypothetical protein